MTVAAWAAEARASAAVVEHPWDRAALDWPLTPASVVVEVGGYKGRWALQIAERYRPRLYVFEPQPWAAATCREVLGARATIEDYALGTADGMRPLAHAGTDGATLVRGDGPLVAVREIGAAFADLGIETIDLMLMNIEGGEYTLIPHMLRRGIRPRALMVQRHAHADPGDGALDAALAGYRVRWTYGPVLTAWEDV
ncbi:MAG TPA: hypothetical protein VFO85_06705 [Vicinamibacteria bacterium]|nr:hypothetical protein [Vicinamibacteria bacterium]